METLSALTLLLLLNHLTASCTTQITQSAPASVTTPSRHPNNNDSSLITCGTCDRTVAWEDRSIVCESCNQWSQATCQSVGPAHLTTSMSLMLADTGLSVVAPTTAVSSIDLHAVSPKHTDSTACSIKFTYEAFTPFHSSTPTHTSKQDWNRNRPLRILNIKFKSAVAKKTNRNQLSHPEYKA